MDMDIEALERLKFFFKEVNIVFSQRQKFFSMHSSNETDDQNEIFDCFMHIWFYQAANGFCQVFNPSTQTISNNRSALIYLNIGFLKNMAKIHLQQLGKIFFKLSKDFFQVII